MAVVFFHGVFVLWPEEQKHAKFPASEVPKCDLIHETSGEATTADSTLPEVRRSYHRYWPFGFSLMSF